MLNQTVADYLEAEKKYRNGNTKWFPHQTDENDVARGEAFIRDFCTDQRQVTRLATLGRLFMNINHHLPPDQQMLALVGQWLSCGLSAGTMETYWRIVTAGMDETPTMARLTKAIARHHALADISHAFDVSYAGCMRIVANMHRRPLKKIMSWIAAELILKLGMRCDDIRYLEPVQLSFKETTNKVTIKKAKNRTSRGDRTTFTVPCWFGSVSDLTKDFFKYCPPKSRPLMSITSACVNRVLKQSCEPRATTYTLRRAYIRKALEVCKQDVTLAAKLYTMHKRPQTLLAHYVPTVEALKTLREK
jgi:hypothetical protein